MKSGVRCVQLKVATTKGYIPKFNGAFEHFLLHTGGRAVIDEMEEKLSLTPAQCQPSKDALYRFGNTSAASTWYLPSHPPPSCLPPTDLGSMSRLPAVGVVRGVSACAWSTVSASWH